MPTFLAIWGAALSTLLAIFETIRFFLDRPGLKVAPELTIGVEGVWMRAVVTNGGRRTTTVTEAGFKVLAHHEITHEGKTISGERCPVGRARILVLRTIHRLHAMAAARVSAGPFASI